MPEKKPAREKVVSIRLPAETHQRVKVYAAMNGVTITEVVERALEHVLAQPKKRGS